MEINISTNWKPIVENNLTNDLKIKIDEIYKTCNDTFPKKENIFKCFNYFDYQDTKVVILGQDPYPTPGDAKGLAFSVNRSTNLPHSLQNIFKELFNDLHINRTNGDLSDWARQGILLLNTSLVYQHNHLELLQLWTTFTKNIIEFIDRNINGVIFILWGNYAKSYNQYIQNNIQFAIESGHPSFAASHKKFFNTKPFSRANKLLISMNKKPISW